MKTNPTKKAMQIVRKMRRRGFSAYFVGGCVRDMLRGKAGKDIDLATNAKPNQIKKLFSGQNYPVGAKFGTILVVQGGTPFQISTFRGQRNKRPLSIAEDVKQRDFTINGLAYEPIQKQTIDLVGARSDLRKKIIRAIGKPTLRFKQDPLRLIRAIRFAVTLKFDIEPETLRAIKKNSGWIKKVSSERIRDELVLILTSANPALGLKLLDQTNLLAQILPSVEKLKGVKQPRAFHPEGDVFNHTLLMLQQLKHPCLLLSLACLFHDIGKPATFRLADRIRFNNHDRVGAEMTDKILKQLRFSNQDREDVVSCVQNHMHLTAAPKMRPATLKRLFARPTFEQELKLHRIDCLASHKDLGVFRFLLKKYNQFKKQPIIPKPLLNGNLLIKIGFTPGPIFGKIHRQMVDLQLEGKLRNKTQARKWLAKHFGLTRKRKRCLK